MRYNEPMDLILYHGTRRPIEQFQPIGPGHDPTDTGVAWSQTRGLGTFFSTCPRIAAHFTLKPEVIDQGYDSDEGSKTLRENPWRYDSQPFEPGSQVLTCALADEHDPTRLAPMDLMEWMTICEEWSTAQVTEMREELQAQGFHGLYIQEWDGEEEHEDHGTPCVEYHAPTVVLFDATRASITDRRPADQAWEEHRPARSPGLKR